MPDFPTHQQVPPAVARMKNTISTCSAPRPGPIFPIELPGLSKKRSCERRGKIRPVVTLAVSRLATPPPGPWLAYQLQASNTGGALATKQTFHSAALTEPLSSSNIQVHIVFHCPGNLGARRDAKTPKFGMPSSARATDREHQ